MFAITIFIALTLALAVVHQTLDELMPVRMPAALTRTITVAIAALFAWAINYSVFVAFEQPLRQSWMHPVLTGVVLVAAGQFLTSIVAAVAHRAGEPSIDVAPIAGIRAA